MQSPDRTSRGTPRWLKAVVGTAAAVLLAQLLQAVISVSLMGALLDESTGLSDFTVSPISLLSTAAATAVGVAFLRSPRRGWWFFLGGVVMTLTIYVVLGLALSIADSTDGFVDAVQTGFGAIFVLLYFAAILGPLWIFLILCTVGLRLTRRWIDGPAAQLP